jgi:hypothetical protein
MYFVFQGQEKSNEKKMHYYAIKRTKQISAGDFVPQCTSTTLTLPFIHFENVENASEQKGQPLKFLKMSYFIFHLTTS